MSGEERNESEGNASFKRSLRYVIYALAFALVVIPLALGLLVFVFAFPDFQLSLRSISWAIIIISFLVSLGYFYYDSVDTKLPKKPEANPSERNWNYIWKDFELFKLQYEQLSEGIRSRALGSSILHAQ